MLVARAGPVAWGAARRGGGPTVGIPLPLGVVGHEGSTVVVVLNGLRLLRARG